MRAYKISSKDVEGNEFRVRYHLDSSKAKEIWAEQIGKINLTEDCESSSVAQLRFKEIAEQFKKEADAMGYENVDISMPIISYDYEGKSVAKLYCSLTESVCRAKNEIFEVVKEEIEIEE